MISEILILLAVQAEHFDAGVRHWLLQLQLLFGELCAVSALHAIETAANLEVSELPTVVQECSTIAEGAAAAAIALWHPKDDNINLCRQSFKRAFVSCDMYGKRNVERKGLASSKCCLHISDAGHGPRLRCAATPNRALSFPFSGCSPHESLYHHTSYRPL